MSRIASCMKQVANFTSTQLAGLITSTNTILGLIKNGIDVSVASLSQIDLNGQITNTINTTGNTLATAGNATLTAIKNLITTGNATLVALQALDTTRNASLVSILAAIPKAERSVSGRMFHDTGTVVNNLGLPAGTMGRLNAISVSGQTVRMTIDGSAPSAVTSPSFVTAGNHVLGTGGIDLSLVRVHGSTAAAVYTLSYEVWI